MSMISYQDLISFIKYDTKFHVIIKDKYSVISIPNFKYHITIFQDQWDEYAKVTKLNYHLFHISSEQTENRCSSYFWVDKEKYLIHNIPQIYFKYEQETYSFFSSTRQPCEYNEIKPLLILFQKILKNKLNNIKSIPTVTN